MLIVTDMLSDLSDDICIRGDILIDSSIGNSIINVAERRIVARATDFQIDSIGAGLETYLFKTKTPYTISNIKTAINDVLLADYLFGPSDFSIQVVEKNTRTLHLTIIFKSQIIDQSNRFRIIVDIENQRIYRG